MGATKDWTLTQYLLTSLRQKGGVNRHTVANGEPVGLVGKPDHSQQLSKLFVCDRSPQSDFDKCLVRYFASCHCKTIFYSIPTCISSTTALLVPARVR